MHKALTTQLAEAGYSAADVTYLALSHYHYYYTANANAFLTCHMADPAGGSATPCSPTRRPR